jgi:two-component system, OmpR family, alkaline phosphatase synthesis response regulator PhoP
MVSPKRPLILSVDDESEIRELIRLHLERAGFNVVTAGNGEEAIEIVRRELPDVIVLDVMLPDVNGFGLCEILRSCETTASVPIVMLTACSSAESHKVARDTGANDYVNKPFRPAELIECVRKHLARGPLPAPKPRRAKAKAPRLTGSK